MILPTRRPLGAHAARVRGLQNNALLAIKRAFFWRPRTRAACAPRLNSTPLPSGREFGLNFSFPDGSLPRVFVGIQLLVSLLLNAANSTKGRVSSPDTHFEVETLYRSFLLSPIARIYAGERFLPPEFDRSRVSAPGDNTMDISSHDVLLVGGGGAGLRAAIAISEFNPNLSVAVVSKVYPMRSHTVSAEGGAAGVIKPGDTLDEHAYDTISGGDWMCDQDAVELFVQEAPRE